MSTLQFEFSNNPANEKPELKLLAVDATDAEKILLYNMLMGYYGRPRIIGGIDNNGMATMVKMVFEKDVPDGETIATQEWVQEQGYYKPNEGEIVATQSWVTEQLNNQEPLVYSLDEVLTGKTWIDGKPIYRKIIQTSIDAELDIDLTPLDINQFLPTSNFFYKVDNGETLSPYLPLPVGDSGDYSITINTNNIKLKTLAMGIMFYSIIEYTKNSEPIVIINPGS